MTTPSLKLLTFEIFASLVYIGLGGLFRASIKMLQKGTSGAKWPGTQVLQPLR